MNKIFVSIASYRDSELPKTVDNIISNAEHPELLKIVVYEQNGPEDPAGAKRPSGETASAKSAPDSFNIDRIR